MSDMPEGLEGAITTAAVAALKGDDGTLSEAMYKIADIDFPAGVAFACYTWARIAASAMIGSPQKLMQYSSSGAAAGVQFATQEGRIVNAEEADPRIRFVGRMIACAFNEDHRAAMDLWATLEEDIWADCAVQMVRFAAQVVKSRAYKDLGWFFGAVP